jgi:hypothetical protein
MLNSAVQASNIDVHQEMRLAGHPSSKRLSKGKWGNILRAKLYKD